MAKSEKLQLDLQMSDNSKPPTPIPAPTPTRVTRSSPFTVEMDLNTLFKFIKPFDGSRDTLNSFLVNCNNAYELASETQKPILFKYIISQLSGKAEVACSIKEFPNWDHLKDFLKNQFSNRKHYAHLLTELQESKQGTLDSVSQFALRVETLLSQLLVEVSTSTSKAKELPGRAAAMEDLALHHFLMGLYPRLSNIVRCRSPRNLNEAINLAISEERIQQTLYRRAPNEPKPNNTNRNINNRPGPSRPITYPSYNSNTNNTRPFNSQGTQFCRYCKTPGHDISACKRREYNNNRFKSSQPTQFNSHAKQSTRVNHLTDAPETDYDNIGQDEVDIAVDTNNDDLND